MLIAILLLVIFNIGLTFFVLAGVAIAKDDIAKGINALAKHTDESIEAATTAIFNMESIKQKADMTGRFEV
jgi:hypothetical protein